MVVVGDWEEQSSDLVSSERVNLVPGVPGCPPWSKGKVMPPPPCEKMNDIYKVERIFQIGWLVGG